MAKSTEYTSFRIPTNLHKIISDSHKEKKSKLSLQKFFDEVLEAGVKVKRLNKNIKG